MEQRKEDDARRKEGSGIEQRECERMGWPEKSRIVERGGEWKSIERASGCQGKDR